MSKGDQFQMFTIQKLAEIQAKHDPSFMQLEGYTGSSIVNRQGWKFVLHFKSAEHMVAAKATGLIPDLVEGFPVVIDLSDNTETHNAQIVSQKAKNLLLENSKGIK